MRTRSFIALIAVAAIGCSNAGGPSPSADAVAASPSATSVASPTPTVAPPSPTVAPTASPTPIPSKPADLARTSVAVRDDIRVEIELQRNPLPAGEPSWIKATVSNDGTTDVTWFHDGCANPVGTSGVSHVPWRMGVTHAEQGEMFKAYGLGGWLRDPPDPHASFSFVREERMHVGRTGCADIGISDIIEPGDSITETRWWSGFADPTRALPLAGAATIRGYAGYYWRGDEPEDITSQAIGLELDARIIGDEGAERLSPAEAVDAALADPEFLAYLDTQDLGNGRAHIVWYDAAHDRWEIGVMPWYEDEPPRIHGVLVDAVTGAILGPLDRPWDQDVDPFPMT
jgi:hypothetical protein